jgi:GNAT superfamily N-acetyltransferase
MLTIVPLNRSNVSHFNRADARYLAGERVQLRVTRLGFLTDYSPLPTAEWRTLRPFPADPMRLLADPNAACFLAFIDGQPVGQCVVRLGSHRLCELLDLRVDSRFRRQSAGTQLIAACGQWAQAKARAGLRAELTDGQPVACQFMEKVGFTLGGVDRLWHSALPDQQKLVPAMRESVLVFYKFLPLTEA